MSPYYGIRRLGPYLGVIQVIDVGDACAYSTNGHSWRIRQQTASGRFRWGVPHAAGTGNDPVRITNAPKLVEALERHPPVPFPIRDRYELWLLRQETRKPLALLSTRYRAEEMDAVRDPHWRAFPTTDSGFVSPTLLEREAVSSRQRHPSHRDELENMINMASRPLPAAQWFERRPDGSGIGLNGLRLVKNETGRMLSAEAFPELLVSEDWPDSNMCGLIDDYHNWCAGSLLAHQNLSVATRKRLERAACQRPTGLLAVYPLIPEILDKDAIDIALVSAKLMNAC
ncbi:hypothetical protein DFR30_0145 [Thiogranum longum]|uniref:Uncharacterized protein n=1 Tax=Thiogranum longum TaxID=1537524 RepID=A0A4V2PGI1_9GAMM|nr:hypothetical protein [Thiogranum longum]TCK16926.1 hypothetical protein DFR30_0145 [Thiogranum longum]